MLIGWSIGGIVGPLLIASLIGEEKAYTLGFTVVGLIALAALALPLITKPPRQRTQAPPETRHPPSVVAGRDGRPPVLLADVGRAAVDGQALGQPRLDATDHVRGVRAGRRPAARPPPGWS